MTLQLHFLGLVIGKPFRVRHPMKYKRMLTAARRMA
jgi:hypothetical protein